jgi:hypothetical protein
LDKTLPDSNQVLQAFKINTRRTIRADPNMADQTKVILQQMQMQTQIAQLQLELAASAAATLAATNAAAAATAAFAGLPPAGVPTL